MILSLDEKEVIQKMEDRGFSKLSHTIQDDQIVKLSFATNFSPDSVTIGCHVDLIKGTFKFQYSVPCSINLLTTPECSSFMDDTHFYRLFKKLEMQANLLDEYFNN